MRIVLACLALGVGAIAAVGSLRAAVQAGMAQQGRALLGGDISIDSGATAPPERLRAWLTARGDIVSSIILLRTLLVAPSGERMLVELKAVGRAYPLVGQVGLAPAMPIARALAGGVVADPLVLERLGLAPGAMVRLGDAHIILRAALRDEPDHAGGFTILGPRVLIAMAALPATGLVRPGSLLDHEWRVRLARGQSAPATIAALRQAFPETGWRIRDPSQAESGIEEAVRQTSLFLALVGLSALLVGGIGVATGVRAWLEGRARTIATLRCLGAPARLVFCMILAQVLALCGAGIAIGLAIGAMVPLLVIALFGASLPVPAAIGVYPAPLAMAGLYGLLTAGTFALWPLGRAARIPGAALFRAAILPQGGPGKPVAAATLALGGLLAALIVGGAESKGFALAFCGATGLILALFRAGAWALMRAARAERLMRAPRRPAWASLGFSRLYRPGAATVLLLASVGLGLTSLAAVMLIEGNIEHQFSASLNSAAPSFFFIDIQNDELARFRTIVGDMPGTSDLRIVPSLRARIVALNGVAAESAHVAPGARWALRGDRGLTYAAALPQGSRVVAGAWWPADYRGPPALSLDDGLARGWGLHVGDTLMLNVLGRDILFRIASLRAIDWRALGINFTLVAAPGLLESAPQMHIATLRDPPARDGALLRAVNDALPNVTGIRVADILNRIAILVGQLATALSAAGAITLVAGILVLAGAIAAGQRQRMAEAVILRVLGASAAQIRGAWLLEFGLIGVSAGLLAGLAGTLASWAVTHFALHADWSPLPGRLMLTVLGCLLAMLAFGYLGTIRALRARPARLLRDP